MIINCNLCFQWTYIVIYRHMASTTCNSHFAGWTICWHASCRCTAPSDCGTHISQSPTALPCSTCTCARHSFCTGRSSWCNKTISRWVSRRKDLPFLQRLLIVAILLCDRVSCCCYKICQHTTGPIDKSTFCWPRHSAWSSRMRMRPSIWRRRVDKSNTNNAYT